MRWHDGLNIDHAYLNIHEVTLWVFWIFKRCRHGLFWISMKLSHGYFEYSWSDVIGILNVQKLTSSEYSKADVGVNIHEMTMGILNIQKLTSWTFWIFMRWCHWYFEYEVTLWNYSEADANGILNIHSGIGIFNIQNYVFWIFIVMTSLQEYSKYPWRQLWIFPWRQFVRIQNTHDMNIHNNHGVSLWIFKIPMASAS